MAQSAFDHYEIIATGTYQRRAGNFYIVDSDVDEIPEIQQFQDETYTQLNERSRKLVHPRSADYRLSVKRNGGYHFTVRDANSHQVIGILIGASVSSVSEYEEKISFNLRAGRSCAWTRRCMILTTAFIHPQYQMNGVAEALFEAAIKAGYRDGIDGFGFVIGHANRAYIKCALRMGFYIIGSGMHKILETKMFLFEKAPLAHSVENNGHVTIEMTQTVFDDIAVENYLDDNYAIVDMGLYHPSFTFARLQSVFADSTTADRYLA